MENIGNAQRIIIIIFFFLNKYSFQFCFKYIFWFLSSSTFLDYLKTDFCFLRFRSWKNFISSSSGYQVSRLDVSSGLLCVFLVFHKLTYLNSHVFVYSDVRSVLCVSLALVRFTLYFQIVYFILFLYYILYLFSSSLTINLCEHSVTSTLLVI